MWLRKNTANRAVYFMLHKLIVLNVVPQHCVFYVW